MNKKLIVWILVAIIATGVVAAGVTITAKAFMSKQGAEALSGEDGAEALSDERPLLFEASYREVNSECKGDVVSLKFSGDTVAVWLAGLYDLAFGYSGKTSNLEQEGHTISFDCVLNPMGMADVADKRNVAAHMVLKLLSSGVYELQLAFKEKQDNAFSLIEGTTLLYRCDDERVEGMVPAKIDGEVSVVSLVKAVMPYVFSQEMLATYSYIFNHSELSETEVVKVDERNRYLEYSWGDEEQCMECKYWVAADGNVLMVVNFHDPTYQYPQKLRFFRFVKADGSMHELRSALSEKWPVSQDGENGGIFYQLRYNSDGIVALVPKEDGESFDVVTLNFDGEVFK